MVAYSFKAYFAPQIETGVKTQTVRADRRRHARPGEALQLFVGMRTRHCRKLLGRDPTCLFVSSINIQTNTLVDGIASIEIDGRVLHRDEIEAFARADGFAPEHINGLAIDMTGKTARENMGRFWLDAHGAGSFQCVLIGWGDAP